MSSANFVVATDQSRQIIDISDQVADAVRESRIQDGIVCVSVAHCTCALYVNENEAGLLQDTLDMLYGIAASLRWKHDRIDNNANAHLAASVIGNSVTLPVQAGKIVLGTWQRILFVELDGPRASRHITVTAICDN